VNDTAFAEALEHHQAGRLDAAAALYRAILAREPNHADSLHLLGLITAETADPIAGITLIRRAMSLDPGQAPHHNSLGHAYRRLGAHYRQAVAVAPDVADIWYNLANVQAATSSPGVDFAYRTAICLAGNPTIVTWPGPLMRGRHTAAILRRIGCEATVADTLDEYVSITGRLARDPAWRAQVRQAVAAGQAPCVRCRALHARPGSIPDRSGRGQLGMTWADTARHVVPWRIHTSV
jgi:predicted O-linked N-acetylglucosamine transferase (SPINDLY family)